MIRCFVAVDPPAPVLAKLATLRRELAACGADVRWAREDGLHCTLKFLGSVGEDRVHGIGEALERALRQVPAFAVAARGLGVFPNWRGPRVVWAGLQDVREEAGLASLARGIEAALVPLGFAAEPRPFKAHLTLGRVRSMAGWSRLGKRMQELRDVECGEFRVDGVVLYRSQLGPGGSVYSPLAEIPLAG